MSGYVKLVKVWYHFTLKRYRLIDINSLVGTVFLIFGTVTALPSKLYLARIRARVRKQPT